MKQLFILCFCLSLLFPGKLAAQQKQGAWWYFGFSAGLNFNTEPPTPDSSGQTNPSGGVASVSDANGNLLFYSDGISVFNRLHQVMANGGNIKPSANSNASMVMIVQKPGSAYLYYLFTVQRYNSSSPIQNFVYSIIDIRLDNGKGGILPTAKNILVTSIPMAEKLTAAMHANNRDVWVVVHSRTGNIFYSYLVSAAGIGAPVTTIIGEMYSNQWLGVMKCSPNSSLIGDAGNFGSKTQLLDFNRSTGVLSNARTFTFPANTRPYGVAFSPDNSKLYLGDVISIYQYSLQAGTFQDVLTSKITISNNNSIWAWDFQLGMNGKIYIIPADFQTGRLNDYLSIINCPNNLGLACNLQDTAIYLGRDAGVNLPALNQTLFRNANELQLTAAKPYICPGDSVTLSAFGAGADTFTWLAAPGLTKNSGSQVWVKPLATTTYTVIGYSQCTSDTATVSVQVVPPAFINAGPDKVICVSGSVTLGSSAQPGLSYAWNASPYLSDTTLANPVFTFPNAPATDQVFELVVSLDGPGSSCGNRSDTVLVTVKAPVQANAGASFSVCSGKTTLLNPQQFNNTFTYSWSPATGLSNAAVFAPSLTLTNFSGRPDTVFYTLTASNGSCSATSQLQVIVLPVPKPVIAGPVSVCPGSHQIKYNIQNHLSGYSYSWGVSGGTINQIFTDSVWVNWGASSATANVWVIAQNAFSCHSDTVFFPVKVNPLLSTEKPKGAAMLCQNNRLNQLYSISKTNGSVYSWGISAGTISGGQGSSSVTINWPGPGSYKIWVQESAQTSLAQCFGISDSLLVTVLPSPDTLLAVQGPVSVCHQSTHTYSLAGNSGSVYQWQVSGGTILTGQSSNTITVQWQTTGPGELKVLETHPNNCAGKWLVLKIQVNPLPQPVVNNTNYFCPEALQQTYQIQGLAGSAFQWQITGGTILTGQGSNQISVLWDSLSNARSFNVVETTSSGCTAASATVSVTFDNSEPELLATGINEAETEILFKYRIKNSQHYPVAHIPIESRNPETNQWQQKFIAPVKQTLFSTPVSDFSLNRYRLRGTNQCGSNLLSAEHQFVNLFASGEEKSGSVQLTWTAYRGWPGQIMYEIWQQPETGMPFTRLTTSSDTSIVLQTGRSGFQQRYRIKAVVAGGLESWSKSVSLNFKNELGFPNLITPNNDGMNETLTAESLHLYPNTSLQIFNRFGKEVFKSRNYQGNWNASGLPEGTYYYLFTTQAGKNFKGWVEVVR